jgi:hypothetical protein
VDGFDTYVARRRILPGEEITTDCARGGARTLADERLAERPPAADVTTNYPTDDCMPCNCGHAHCRHQARAAAARLTARLTTTPPAQVCLAEDYKRPELQERYGSHFLPSILAHIVPDAPPPLIAFGDTEDADPHRPGRAGLCGLPQVARDYCPIF